MLYFSCFFFLFFCFRRLWEVGVKDEDIKQLVEMGYDAWKERYESETNLPHNDETSWFLKDCTRLEAEELLADAPTGTFLIRARSAGHYALSIACKQTINHCIIYQTERAYGFAAPYNIYSSLKKLVLHYANNSLEEHNDTLTTTLKYPVFYWQQQRQLIQQQQLQIAETATVEAAAAAATVTAAAATTTTTTSVLGAMAPPPQPPPPPEDTTTIATTATQEQQQQQ